MQEEEDPEALLVDQIDSDEERDLQQEEQYEIVGTDCSKAIQGDLENPLKTDGYHITDPNDLLSDESEEELDEDEKQQRHREMLKEFKEKCERDDLDKQ